MLGQVFNMLSICPPGCCSTGVQQVFNRLNTTTVCAVFAQCLRGVCSIVCLRPFAWLARGASRPHARGLVLQPQRRHHSSSSRPTLTRVRSRDRAVVPGPRRGHMWRVSRGGLGSMQGAGWAWVGGSLGSRMGPHLGLWGAHGSAHAVLGPCVVETCGPKTA